MPISTPAIVGVGNTTINTKSIVPKNNFFILLPLIHISSFVSHLAFPASHNQQHDAAHERNSPTTQLPSPPLKEADYNDNDGNDQEEMISHNKSSARQSADQPEDAKYNEIDGNNITQ
jgi:hypothetical protein